MINREIIIKKGQHLNVCSSGTRLNLDSVQFKDILYKVSPNSKLVVVKLNCRLQVIMREGKAAARPRFRGYERVSFCPSQDCCPS